MYSVQASFFTVKRGPFSAVVNVSTDEGGNNVHRESIKTNLRKIFTVESATTSLEKNTYQKKQALMEVWEKSKKLWKRSPVGSSVFRRAFLVLPNLHSCFY